MQVHQYLFFIIFLLFPCYSSSQRNIRTVSFSSFISPFYCWRQTRLKMLEHLEKRSGCRTNRKTFGLTQFRSNSRFARRTLQKFGKRKNKFEKRKKKAKISLKIGNKCQEKNLNGARMSQCLMVRKDGKYRTKKRCKRKRIRPQQVALSLRKRRLRCSREKRRRSRIFARVDHRSRRSGRGSNAGRSNIFGGDIMMTKDQIREMIYNVPGCPGKRRRGRSSNNIKEHLWPGGLVSYELSTNLKEEHKPVIRTALQELQSKLDSCIRFEEVNSGNRILVIPSIHSKSYIGFQYPVQDLELSHFSKTTIWHEFLHAIGLHHTQTRSDRENHIKILWDNIHMLRVQKHFGN